ncbi:MAG: glycosyltransferase family 9 protein [Gemmatimonadota bacterium]
MARRPWGESGGGRLVIRAPNHLGDLVMAIPALQAESADVLVLRWLAPLLAMADLPGAVIPFDRGFSGFLRAARTVRSERYCRGVLLPPSLSSALLLGAGGVRELRGTATDGRRPLLSSVVDLADAKSMHRSALYHFLVTGVRPAETLVPRLKVSEAARGSWGKLAGDHALRTVGLFPGSNASSRRWDAARWKDLAGHLVASGRNVVVFGSASERELTAEVAGTSAFDAGGKTDLAVLAAGLAGCELFISNDSGPLHLAAAVGTSTLSLWGAGDPAITGLTGGAHRMLRRADLACVPCVRNVCPRTGPGYILEAAERECLCLIRVDDVLAAVS